MSSGDSDADIWRTIGHDLTQTFVAVVVKTFVIAIYSVLVFKTVRLLMRKEHTNISLYGCTAVLAIYLITVVLWIIDIHNVVTEIQMTLLSSSSDSLADKYSAAQSRILHLASVEDFLYAYLTNIGDAVIIWRAFAFWSSPTERIVLLIPFAFLLGSFTSSIMLTFCATRLGTDIELGTYQHPEFCRDIQTASYSTSLATTTVATLLIAWKAWQYRRIYISAFGLLSPKTKTLRAMAMLIESGILYMIFFSIQIVMSDSAINQRVERSRGLTLALTIYQYNSSLAVGIYPTIVVVLVKSKLSMVNSTVASTRSVLVFRHHLHEISGGLSTHVNSTSATAEPAHELEADTDPYEMLRVKGKSTAESKVPDPLRYQVHRAVSFDD